MATSQEPVAALALFDDVCGPKPVLESSSILADDGEFEDASDQPPTDIMDLSTAFIECEMAVQKFFNNDVSGAFDLMKPWSKISLYHSLGISIFKFIPAMLTFEREQINSALESIKECVALCGRHRRVLSFTEHIKTMIEKPSYSTITDMEAHAELCYAETLLLFAAMTIVEGEDLTGLIKGTIKIKNCYSCYKHCMKILEKKKWESEESKIQFHSGVRLGVATFNVMISMLPPKVITLLEFVGFSGSKSYGLAELQAGSRAPGIRSVLCDLTLLGYHLAVCQFTGSEGDLHVCEEILDKQLKVYPNGVWFLLFKARLELLKGKFNESRETYDKASCSQIIWSQFHHVCYWEIMWIKGLTLQWREASWFAGKLIEENSWSRTIYSYTKAAMLLQNGDSLSSEEKKEVVDLTKKALKFKQRIAGKSLPMEKFIIKRCHRFQAQGGHLVLPAVELICLWNMFPILAKNQQAAQNMLRLIENSRDYVENYPQLWMAGYVADNKALVRYLHGCCLAAMGLPHLAIEALDSVFSLKSEIKEDSFLLPYTVAELAMCYYRLGENDRALRLLHDAKKKFNGYSLESRLHFRLHSKTEIINSNMNL